MKESGGDISEPLVRGVVSPSGPLVSGLPSSIPDRSLQQTLSEEFASRADQTTSGIDRLLASFEASLKARVSAKTDPMVEFRSFRTRQEEVNKGEPKADMEESSRSALHREGAYLRGSWEILL